MAKEAYRKPSESDGERRKERNNAHAPHVSSRLEQTDPPTVPLWEGQQTPACETKKIAFCWSQQNDWGGDREVDFLIKNTPFCKVQFTN